MLSASYILLLTLATALSAPSPSSSPQKDELLRALINPTPETLQKLNQFSATLKMEPSLAAMFPELAPEPNLANQPLDLNSAGGLNSLVTRLITAMIERLLSGQTTVPGVGGNGGIFGTATGTLPSQTSQPSPFFGAASNPFGMFFPSMMFGNMMEGFMEFF